MAIAAPPVMFRPDGSLDLYFGPIAACNHPIGGFKPILGVGWFDRWIADLNRSKRPPKHITTRRASVVVAPEAAICVGASARASPPGHQTALTRDLQDRKSRPERNALRRPDGV